MLLALPDDELLQVLSPFCVTSHGLLRLVCQRLKVLVASDELLQLRRTNKLVQTALMVFGGRTSLGHEQQKCVALVRNKWEPLAECPGHTLGSCQAILGEDLFVFCGDNGTFREDERVYKYSFTADAWQVISHTPLGSLGYVEGAICEAVGDVIVVAGGGQFREQADGNVWAFDPSAVSLRPGEEVEESIRNAPVQAYWPDEEFDKDAYWAALGWTELPKLPYAVADGWEASCRARSFVVDNRLYIVGGEGNDGSWPSEDDEKAFNRRTNQPVKWVQMLDMTTREWDVLDEVTPPQIDPWRMLDGPVAKQIVANENSANQWFALWPGGGIVVVSHYGCLIYISPSGVEYDSIEYSTEEEPSWFGRKGGSSHVQCARIAAFELRADCVPVRRIAARTSRVAYPTGRIPSWLDREQEDDESSSSSSELDYESSSRSSDGLDQRSWIGSADGFESIELID